MRYIIIMLVGTLLSLSALAEGLVINPNITYISRNITDSVNPEGSFNQMTIDTKFGHMLPMGLFFGLQLGYSFQDPGSGDNTAYQMGPTVGYEFHDMPLFVSATYHLLGVHEIGSGGTQVNYEDVTGPQIDLGLPFEISKCMSVGPQLSYKFLTLKDKDGSGGKVTINEYVPYLGLWMKF